MGNKLLTAIQVLVGLLVAAGAVWLGTRLYSYRAARTAYAEMNSTYLQSAAPADDGTVADDTVDFAALTAAYPDAAAWLQIDDLGLSYPVMQGADNNTYLHHAPDGSASPAGSLFLDHTNTLQDPHLLIYGHTMQDGSMFGSLKQYKDAAFLNSGSGLITLYTPQETAHYRIFAVQVVPENSEIYTLGFGYDAQFAAFVQKIKNSSLYDTGITPDGTAQVLTLSTCATLDGQGRLVVSAVKQ